METAIASGAGAPDIAQIMGSQRKFNPATTIAGTSAAKDRRKGEQYLQRRAEKSQLFFARKRAETKENKEERQERKQQDL